MGYYKRIYEARQLHNKMQSVKAREKRFSLDAYYQASPRALVGPWPRGFDPFMEGCHMGVLDSVFSGVRSGASEHAAVDEKMSGQFPILMELMTATPLQNGKRRSVATLTCLAEDGVWKLGLRDRDHQVSLWVSGDSWESALASLERALGASHVEWRRTPDYSTRTRK